MKKENIFSKFYEAICKDTGGQNESPKLIVVVRLFILTMIVYSLVNSVLCLSTSHMSGVVFCQISAVLFIAVFLLSYYKRTFVSFCILNACVLVWIVFDLYLFGWNIGVQHFLIALLVFSFFAKYKHVPFKIGYAFFLFVLRLYLFQHCQYYDPVIRLSVEDMTIFQTVNTFTIFWIISMVAHLFSLDTQAMEGKLIEYNEQLKTQASIDPLTGLYNRRHTTEYLDGLLHNPEHPISFCICDIDFFKRVNDTYGHDVGDVVLKQMAETFKTELPVGTFVSRWGGEEFLLIFPESNGDEASLALGKLRQKIKSIVFDGGSQTFSISLTFGLVEYDFHSDLDTLLKEADEKLYFGKEHGRDQIVF